MHTIKDGKDRIHILPCRDGTILFDTFGEAGGKSFTCMNLKVKKAKELRDALTKAIQKASKR